MSAIFKKQNLGLYDVINEPCTVIVKVANTVKSIYLIEDGSKSRYLVNLRIAELASLQEALSILGNQDDCAFSDVAHCFITGVIWEKDVSDLSNLPVKGENIIASFDRDETGVMRCVSITTIPRKQLSKFDLNAYNFSKNKLNKLFQNLNL